MDVFPCSPDTALALGCARSHPVNLYPSPLVQTAHGSFHDDTVCSHCLKRGGFSPSEALFTQADATQLADLFGGHRTKER